ncbi:hypothetical protein CEXT_371651 [Caerostris extrusa]|uniref:Uncharacterized protein n=1 Tax=Caerostris extrusa TaxID=172846 RepID=A0AAV4PUD3_CAEEX|nr:hypothetical protein CEXT_371651 [Caerostris extrusa]
MPPLSHHAPNKIHSLAIYANLFNPLFKTLNRKDSPSLYQTSLSQKKSSAHSNTRKAPSLQFDTKSSTNTSPWMVLGTSRVQFRTEQCSDGRR